MKERLQKEYIGILRMLLNLDLYAKNKITTTGALVVPVLKCAFGIINWRLEEITRIHRENRKILTK
jgi:hypothetical protein